MNRRSDRWSAAAWALFGAVVLVASWRLDRLENLSINPWSAPGLTPGVVGLLVIVLAAVLATQSGRAPSDAVGSPADAPVADAAELAVLAPDAVGPGGEGKLWRTLLASLLCVLFAGVSLGHGLPFMVEGATFILVFATVFSWPQWKAEGRIVPGFLTTLVVAVASAALISWLFESVFLVRLP